MVKGQRDARLLALEMEEASMNKAMQAASRRWKS